MAFQGSDDDGSADAPYRTSNRTSNLDHTVTERLLESREKFVHRFRQELSILGIECKGSKATAGL